MSPSQWLVSFLPGVLPNGVTQLTASHPAMFCHPHFCLYDRQLLKSNLKVRQKRRNCLSLPIIYLLTFKQQKLDLMFVDIFAADALKFEFYK